jgi:ArsR family transcriptional regulator
MSTRLEVRPVSRLFRALADETRLRIIALLSHGELCVCHIQEVLKLPQPNVSRQLGVLRSAGLVEDRREGSWVHYRLRAQEDPDCERQLRSLTDAYSKDGALRREIRRAVNARGPTQCEVSR